MKRGELSAFIISSEYAYKKQGCPPRVPPDCTILAEIEFLQWSDVEEEEDDKIDAMTETEKENLSGEEVLN